MTRADRWAVALLIATMAALGAVIALMIPPPAHADGVLSDSEAAYVERWAQPAICPVIDRHDTIPGVLGVTQAIVNQGWAEDAAVDIINAAVWLHCPEHWPLLVSIGEAIRAETEGPTA